MLSLDQFVWGVAGTISFSVFLALATSFLAKWSLAFGWLRIAATYLVFMFLGIFWSVLDHEKLSVGQGLAVIALLVVLLAMWDNRLQKPFFNGEAFWNKVAMLFLCELTGPLVFALSSILRPF